MEKTNKNLIILITVFIIIGLLGASYYVFFYPKPQVEKKTTETEKIDDRISPLEDQAVSLSINRIRKKGIEDVMRRIGPAWKEKPSYYYTAFLNDIEWSSANINSWDTGYVGWETFRNVEEEQKQCDIEIKIVEIKKKLFSTYEEEADGFKITYDFKTGRWTGDDRWNDSDGYGHYNGENYEIWFDIHQADYDGDGIPYWTEVNVLHTDPKVDDSKCDPNGDGIPISWDWKWGYDSFAYDNHSQLDPDNDGLTNLNEYMLEKWLANPYQKEIYIEVDFMEKGPRLFAHDHVFWEESQQMLMDKFNEHGITVHIDDGCMGGGGEYLEYIGEAIPQESGIASEFYKYHFADDRKGVFHYVFICEKSGWCHPQDYKLAYDCIAIPSNFKYYRETFSPPAITPRLQRVAMSIAVMHELGHSLGLMPAFTEGIDNATIVGRNNLPPLQKLKAQKEATEYWNNYESCMNYAKFGKYVLGYSDGTHGEHDANDWAHIDLTYFQRPSSDEIEGVGS